MSRQMRCVVCQTAPAWQVELTIAHPDDPTMRQLASSGTARILRCGQCGMMVTDPLPAPEQIPALYPTESYPCYSAAQRASGARRWIARQVARASSTRNGLRRQVARAVLFPALRRAGGMPHPTAGPRRILDVGCGDGEFLEAITAAGWETMGLEMAETAAAAGRARGFTIETGTLEAAPFPAHSFSAVRLWHVFEHLLDPRAALRTIRMLLAPGGELILGIPNAASLYARAFGPRWTAWELPRHLYHYTPATIRRLLAEEGFHDIRVSYCSVGTGLASLGPGWNRFLWLRAVELCTDTMWDTLRCGDSLEVHAVAPEAA